MDSAKKNSHSVNHGHANQYSTVALGVLVALVVSAGVMTWRLANSKPVEQKPEPTTPPTRTRIVATKALEAFTLLKENDLKLIKGTAESEATNAPAVADLANRYLLVKVKRNAEVTPELVAPTGATTLLAEATAVSIPATPGSTLGGQLQVGDLIDVVTVPAKQSKPEVFENLMVLNIPNKKDAKPDEKPEVEPKVITLAVPANVRDKFASALAGASVLVARRIPIKN